METTTATQPPSKKVTTSVLATLLGVQPTTIRRGLCVNGHYMGIVPKKMPNGRLLWNEAPALELRGE